METAMGSIGGGKNLRKRKGRNIKSKHQHFASFLSFGIITTMLLMLFAICYILILIILLPLLSMETSKMDDGRNIIQDVQKLDNKYLKKGASAAKEFIEHELGEDIMGELKSKVQQFKQGRGVTDASLMKEAVKEYTEIRKKRQEQYQKQLEEKKKQEENINNDVDAANAAISISDGNDNQPIGPVMDGKRPGFIVLGMHRSGTSMVAGLLVQGLGYNVGAPLIGAHFDNEKGFYELLPVVLQNDVFLTDQHASWLANVFGYNADLAIEHKNNNALDFKEHGIDSLKFLNNPSNIPWLLKDPRLCITIKTWLKLITVPAGAKEPAVLFTYRHPIEVAMSLKKREASFTFEHGIRLWVVYNMRAIQNSNDLCRVVTSQEAVYKNPKSELDRVVSELTNVCGVPAPSIGTSIAQEEIDKFIDPNLVHNKKDKNDEEEKNKEILVPDYDDGNCIIRDYDRSYESGSANDKREETLYIIAMKMYCDMENGKIYKADYEFPKLP